MPVVLIAEARELSGLDHGLATAATVRKDGSVQLSVVHAGIVTHPVSHVDVGAFVARAGTHKIDHLRDHPMATLLWRAGWAWVAMEGVAELCGPDDPLEGVTEADIPRLLCDIARASGVEQEDWNEYERIVAAEGRAAVLVTPRRIYRNP